MKRRRKGKTKWNKIFRRKDYIKIALYALATLAGGFILMVSIAYLSATYVFPDDYSIRDDGFKITEERFQRYEHIHNKGFLGVD